MTQVWSANTCGVDDRVFDKSLMIIIDRVPNNYYHHLKLLIVLLLVKNSSNVKYYQKRHIVVAFELSRHAILPPKL